MLKVHPFRPDTAIRTNDEGKELSAVLDQEVQTLWEAEQERRGKALFNDRLFSVRDFSEGRITGRFVEYRLLIAQRIKPELYEALRVRPLAVSGLLRCASGVVFGRRQASATQDAGLWELAPSGGCGPSSEASKGDIDIGQQLLGELREEIGLEADMVSDISPFCLVEDDESHVVDIGIEIATALGADEIGQAYHRCGSGEYEEIKVVPIPGIKDFMRRNEGRLVEVSRILLGERGLMESR